VGIVRVGLKCNFDAQCFFVSRCSNGFPDRFWHGKIRRDCSLLMVLPDFASGILTVPANLLATVSSQKRRATIYILAIFRNKPTRIYTIINNKNRWTDSILTTWFPFSSGNRFWPYAKSRLRDRKCNMRLCRSCENNMHGFFSHVLHRTCAFGAHPRLSAYVWTGCCRLHAVAVEGSF